MVQWTQLLWVAENMVESSSITTAPAASSSEVRSFYSKSYSTPGSVNVCDCIKDDAQIALLYLILILDDSTGNYQEMMFIPPDYNWINPNHPFDLEAGISLFDPPYWYHSSDSSNKTY